MSSPAAQASVVLLLVTIAVSCAYAHGQTAFGVSVSVLRAYRNSSCVVADARIKNWSSVPAFILVHPSYPYIVAYSLEDDIRLSFHELPAYRVLDPHNPTPEGIRLPPHGTLFIRTRFHLPAQVHLGNYAVRDVALPSLVRVAIGIVRPSELRRFEHGGAPYALSAQKIAETDSVNIRFNPNTESDCSLEDYTITHTDPLRTHSHD